MIGQRQAAILSLIINNYIRTGEPIGSKALAQILPHKVSSATIRNEMAYLSDLGLLTQRHTSGGRIPGKNSFRFYVDNLMKINPLTNEEKNEIKETLSTNSADPERLFRDGEKMLSNISKSVAVFGTVRDTLDCVQGADLIPAGNSKAMVIMLSLGGKIRSSLCSLRCPVDDEFKSLFYKVAREYFIGTPLTDITPALIQNTAPALGNRVFDMLPAFTTLCSLCLEAASGITESYGGRRLLRQKELGGDVYKIIALTSEEDRIRDLLETFAKANSSSALFIGDENIYPELKNAVVLLQKYNYNRSQSAVLGIVSSLRLDYSYVLPRAEYVMNTINDYLNKGGYIIEQR